MGKTSSEVKNRYNNKVYGAITVRLPKELVADFKQQCLDRGDSQAAVIKKAIEEYLKK